MALYARIICLIATGRTTINEVLACELAPLPPSLFDESGSMRLPQGKYRLKEELRVEIPSYKEYSLSNPIITELLIC